MGFFTEQLKEFATRLAKDGYPTALIERAAERNEALEVEILRLQTENVKCIRELEKLKGKK